MNKKLLIIISTHGNEAIGMDAVKKLKEKKLNKYFDVLIANPKALKQNTRFIDCDLNRYYPGEKNSTIYEKRKAYENLKIARQYKYIIDIHEASKGMDDFVIIPREKLGNKFPIEFIDLEKVLLWPEPKGSISELLDNAIELEFGSKNRDRNNMSLKAMKIIEDFINNIYFDKKIFKQKKYYYVYGELFLRDCLVDYNCFVDFEEVNNGGEIFLPLLTKQYLEKDGIICYKIKRVK